ncbi:hypothetical protein VTK56DRAFT_3189 [Thermocarpiscus australiensis]
MWSLISYSLNSIYHFLLFLYSQLFITPAYPTKPFTGKVVIVTGANRGLGLEAARHFVRLGAAKVILAVRNVSSGANARARIADGDRKAVVEVWHLDLQSASSVASFATRADSLPRLDAVVSNAAIATLGFHRATQMGGHESTIAVNVVGTFMLILLLLPKMRATAAKHPGTRPTVTVVGSEVIFHTGFAERRARRIFERTSRLEQSK